MNTINMKKLIVVTSVAVAAAVSVAGVKIALAQHKPEAKISPVQAINAALEKVPGTPFSATFEYDEGKWGYDVIIVHDHKASEIEINAMTGKVGDIEDAAPADEAQELQHDLAAAIKAG